MTTPVIETISAGATVVIFGTIIAKAPIIGDAGGLLVGLGVIVIIAAAIGMLGRR